MNRLLAEKDRRAAMYSRRNLPEPELPPQLCIDCGKQAQVYRDIGRGILSCNACETIYRAKQTAR